jgi:hypothetical protein
LRNSERASLGNECQSVDCDKVRVHRGEDSFIANTFRHIVLFLSHHRAVTLGHHIYLPGAQAHDPATLAHEVAHTGQYNEWGFFKYYGKGVGARLSELTGGDPYSLPNPFPQGKSFSSYGMEQQGQIVENCFNQDIGGACAVSPYHP